MPTTTMWMAIVAAALLQPSPATWTLVEDLRIGAHDGPSALTVVSHATTNSREDVLFLAQPQERVIRRFDARSGRPLGVFGRRGSGPGEFQSISGMAYRNDTLFAADLFQGRIEAFFRPRGCISRRFQGAIPPATRPAGQTKSAPLYCGMNSDPISGMLEFLRSAERLKNVTRTSWTSDGRRESVAEHTWRLCLMALVLGRELGDVDMARLMKMCVIHDLGEAIRGDISATLQPPEGKAAQERADLLELVEPLPDAVRTEIVELWDEYEAAATREARMAKALDKLETIMQHNQGLNPANFDYAFNLGYGVRYTVDHPLIVALRQILDEETRTRAETTQQSAQP